MAHTEISSIVKKLWLVSNTSIWETIVLSIWLCGGTQIQYNHRHTRINHHSDTTDISLYCLIYLLTFLCILGDSKLHSKYKRSFEEKLNSILNRTKDISVSLRRVTRLLQWFIMVCLWLYCTRNQNLVSYNT